SVVSKLFYPVDTELNEQEQKILESLKIWRQTKADEFNLPTYMICSNSELVTLVKVRPDSIEKLSGIRGFGDQKIARFGEEIIAFMNSV
ncbi:MAG: HRDC domain-containing protein, partial [Methanobacterium sp.]